MTRAPVVLRAEMTKSVGPGTAYLLTRLYLADGTVLEQRNPGLPDLEDDWQAIGREADLDGAAARLARQGWAVHLTGARPGPAKPGPAARSSER